ncbi:RING-H2 finger protein ATL56-like [Wolffia australiana]
MAGSSPARRGRGRGAIWREMKRLPTSRFSIKGGSRAGDCAVCLESFREGDRCRALPRCGHSFHRACVDRWLVVAPLCPVCRTGLREEPAEDEYFTRNQPQIGELLLKLAGFPLELYRVVPLLGFL